MLVFNAYLEVPHLGVSESLLLHLLLFDGLSADTSTRRLIR
jgi:hypothetical protein